MISQTVLGVKAENTIGILAQSHGVGSIYLLAIMIIMGLFASNLFIVNLVNCTLLCLPLNSPHINGCIIMVCI